MGNNLSGVSTKGKSHHPSSYDMQVAETVFRALGLRPGDVFLDAGCGLGEYALAAARIVGPTGVVHAFDCDSGCIESLAEQAAACSLPQLHARVADISLPLPLPDASVAACLVATVLHMPAVTRAMPTIFAKLHRVLRPGGRLGIIECNQQVFYGPPLPLWVAARRIVETSHACGFKIGPIINIGYNYLAIFEKPSA